MFDWNDEELTNIIWDDAGESDDHIVPYPDKIEEKPPILFGDPTKRVINGETANVSPVEQKQSTVKSENGVEFDDNSKYDNVDQASGFVLDSWPDEFDPSLSDAVKTDQDSIKTAALNNLAKNSNTGSLRDVVIQFNEDSEIFQTTSEDREPGDFVDDGWANIGSFDDLDKIFSNNDPIFGDIGVGSSNELWKSSKDVTNSPLGSTSLPSDSTTELALEPLRTSSDRSKIQPEYKLAAGQSFISGHEKANEFTSHDPENVQTLDDGTAAALLNDFPNKGNTKKRLLKGQKLDKKSEVGQLHDFCGNRSSFHSQYAPSAVNSSPPVVLTQQRQIQRPGSLQLSQISGPVLASPPVYGNVLNHHPGLPALMQFHHQGGNCEPASSDFEVPPGNSKSLRKSADAAVKTSSMTPKEKIEKLRRRQQMRALLAIQKQQLRFGNQMAVVEHSTLEGGNVVVEETVCSFPSLDPNSPSKHDDSGTTGLAFGNCSGEESILCHLQDVIAKMDIQLRLCIRDSLFRLAQSAMQRQYASDTSSTNTSSRDLLNQDIDERERFTRMPEVETRTNPIDRTVAHLLFYRSVELSGKHAEMPDTSLSPYLPYGRKATSLKSLAKGFLPDDSEDTQTTSPQGSKTHGLFSGGNRSKRSPCLDTSEHASTNEAADGEVAKTETSK